MKFCVYELLWLCYLGPIFMSNHHFFGAIKGTYWISPNSSFIQYCDSNIGLFSIAPPLVIALPTLR